MSEAEASRKVSIGISRRYRLFRRIMVKLGEILLGFEVHGAERVPDSGGLIVVSNHRQYLDPVYVSMAVARRLQWMGKKQLFVFPFKRFFYLIGCFPVDREGGGRAALKAALRYLQRGAALGIFPEGTRRKHGYDPQDAPKSGMVMLAARSGAPVLPVHVGTAPGPINRLKGARLEVHIGEPTTIEVKGGSYPEAAEELLGYIYSLPDESLPGERRV